MSRRQRLTAMAVGAMCLLGPGVADALAAVTPGWECVPATAGHPVVSGGTGTSPSCGSGSTAVVAPTFVSAGVDGRPTVRFSGVNVQVVSGSGSTSGAVNGEGNLIVGYAEDPGTLAQSGSNDLIVGSGNSWSSYGEIVGGTDNTVSGVFATAFGEHNTASGEDSSVAGGNHDEASGANGSSVSGGADNTASGGSSSVSGGAENAAKGGNSSVSGGESNTASGPQASVAGGQFNAAGDPFAEVSGGCENLAGQGFVPMKTCSASGAEAVGGGFRDRASGWRSFAAGGSFNTASGVQGSALGGDSNQAAFPSGGNGTSGNDDMTVFGGAANAATGDTSTIAGGVANVAAGENSLIAGGEDNTTASGLGSALSEFGGLNETLNSATNTESQVGHTLFAP